MELLGPLLSLVIIFVLKSIMSGVRIAIQLFFFLSIFMKHIFPSLCFQSVWLLLSEVSLLSSIGTTGGVGS